MRKKLIVAVIASLLFTLPLAAVAASTAPRIVISEVNWAGSSVSNADEWLELQNLEGETIDLSGWSIEGAGGSSALTLPAGATIEARGTYLIGNYDAEHSALAIEPDFVTTLVSLSNSALKLTLKNAEGIVVDVAGDGKAPSAGSSKIPFASVIRTESGWTTAEVYKNFDAETDALGTPGMADLAVPEPELSITPITSDPFVTETEVDSSPSTDSVDATDPPVVAEEPLEAMESLETTEEVANTSIEQIITEAVMGTSVEEVTQEETSEVTPSEESLEEAPSDQIPTRSLTTETPAATYVPGDLVINEVVSNPTNNNEWVEIFNPYDNVIPLSGWKLTEAGGTSIPLTGLIGEQSFIVIEFNNRLNNGGDTLMLSDPSGVIVDDVKFGEDGEIDAPAKGQSLARNEDGEFVVTTTPTPYDVNVIKKPEVKKEEQTEKTTKEKGERQTQETTSQDCKTADTLAIIKLLPDPFDDEETTELITIENTGDEAVCLDGWTLSDASKTYKLIGELGGHLRLELPRLATKIALNNTSEEVLLTNPLGEVINTISYEKAIEGAVYTLLDGQWSWQTVSSGDEQEDVQCPDTQSGSDESAENAGSRTSSISTTKTTKKTTAQRSVEGVVIATPGTFGEQIMYINGLQLYQYSSDFPALEVGDVISVSGVPSTSHGEARLKVASAENVAIVGTDTADPAPIELADASGHIGKLVQVEGMVTRRSGDRLTLEQDSVALTVIAKESTDVGFSDLALGTTLSITGVVSTYDGSTRLLPRSTEDIEVQEESEASNEETNVTSTKSPLAGIGLVGATTTAVGARALWWRRKKTQS